MEIGKRYIERDGRATRVVEVVGYWRTGEDPVSKAGTAVRNGHVSIVTISYNGVPIQRARATFVRCARFGKAFRPAGDTVSLA